MPPIHDVGKIDRPPEDPVAIEHDQLLQRLRDLLDEHDRPGHVRDGAKSRLDPANWTGRCDPRMLAGHVARFQRQLRLRARFVDPSVAVEPAWPMLLELFMSALTDAPVTTKQLIFAASVPPTTSLRWTNMLVEKGYVERYRTDTDRRLTLLRISERGFMEMERYFRHLQDREPG